MSKCRDCQYCSTYSDYGVCQFTSYVVKPDVEHNCECFNKDLSGYDICYNCKYYRGGKDWGLFCSKLYHHLGNFNDEPCEFYKRIQNKEYIENKQL